MSPKFPLRICECTTCNLHGPGKQVSILSSLLLGTCCSITLPGAFTRQFYSTLANLWCIERAMDPQVAAWRLPLMSASPAGTLKRGLKKETIRADGLILVHG